MSSTTIQYFIWEYLPPELQPIARNISELAFKMEAELPDSAEKSAGMRKLLEAKDCFIRAKAEEEGFVKKFRKPTRNGKP